MKNTGDGRRIAKVEKEVQQLVAQYLISEVKFSLNGIVTVAKVMMPADLRTAKVFISVLGEESQQQEVVDKLQEQAARVQRFIGDHLRMRYCPKLTFLKDETTDHILKIEGILKDLEVERQGKKSEGDPS